jgi:gluconokinase
MLTYNAHVPINGELPSTNSMSTTMDPLGPNPQPIDATMTPVTSRNTIAKVDGQQGPKLHHIWLVTGPAGCGKTTVAEHLSLSLKLSYIEGDTVSST